MQVNLSIIQQFRNQFREIRRPWKLVTLACGIVLLITGAMFMNAPDWDIPISLIMAVMAYLTSSWSLRAVIEQRWKHLPLALLFGWFSVDGVYWLYWSCVDPQALKILRVSNLGVSLSLYLACGVVWYHNGSLMKLFRNFCHKR